jgi:hypothetical protein
MRMPREPPSNRDATAPRSRPTSPRPVRTASRACRSSCSRASTGSPAPSPPRCSRRCWSRSRASATEPRREPRFDGCRAHAVHHGRGRPGRARLRGRRVHDRTSARAASVARASIDAVAARPCSISPRTRASRCARDPRGRTFRPWATPESKDAMGGGARQRASLVSGGAKRNHRPPRGARRADPGRVYSGSLMSATVASSARTSASASTKRLRPCSPAPIDTRRPGIVASTMTGQARVDPSGVMVPRS